MFTKKYVIVLSIELFVVGALITWLVFFELFKNDIFPPRQGGLWSIGIYMGNSPFSLYSNKNGISNPVLKAEDVTDTKAKFLADPFMVREAGKYYMFFEVFEQNSRITKIAYAESKDCMKWEYKKLVIKEPFPVSYPLVFKYKDTYYMTPESHATKKVKLYKATRFPDKWELCKDIIDGDFTDPTVFFSNSKCWLFAASGDSTLHLFYADSLTGQWKEHPKSPVVANNANIARCGGRILDYNNRLFRFPQDDLPYYGSQVRCFEITKLSETEFEEKEINESPVLRPSRIDFSWNGRGMHTFDVHQLSLGIWIACVDGL